MFGPKCIRIAGYLALAAILGTLGLMFFDTANESLTAAQPDNKDAPVVVYRGARIHTAAGPVIERGVLVVQKGKIIAVGPDSDIKIPAGAVVHDLTGKTIVPGLVDTHSHIGIFSRPQVAGNADGNEMTGPVQPGLRAIDAINPDDPGIRMAVAGGVTTANIMPGSGNAIGGQTLYVKLKGSIIDIMRALSRLVLGGIKFANGENVKGAYGAKNQAPGTRMKIAALQREMLVKAQGYKRQWDTYKKDTADGKKATPPERDLALEPLVEALERRRTVHFHCHRADDILTAVRLAKEFGFELVLQHCTEGYRVAVELAKEGIWVSLTLIDSPGGKPEVMGLLEENVAILHKAGVKVAINTDDFITESRFLLRTGAIAIRGGLPEDVALKALTLHGAQMLHLEDRIGSLEPGKDADFVVLSGAPFSVYTLVLETYIEGDKVFDRSIHQDWTYQAGGFALPAKDRLPKVTAAAKALPEVKTPEMPAGAAAPKDAPTKLVILAGRIHTVGKGTIENGAVLVENGKIAYIGPRQDFKLPKDVPVVTAAVVTPGLIDAHSVVGLSGALNFKKGDQDQDEISDPNQADLRVLDSFNPTEPLLQFIREHGVTVVQALPGRANVIAGQAGIFRTHGRTAEGMALRFPSAILVNMGEIPKTTYPGKLPSTRMGTANLVRTAFAQAQAYARKKESAKEPPTVNLKHEALEAALKKKIPVLFAAHPRPDDLYNARLRLAKEFDLKPTLTLAAEGYLVADEIVQSQVPGHRPSDHAAAGQHGNLQRPARQRCFPGGPENPHRHLHRLRRLCPQNARAPLRGGHRHGERPGLRPRPLRAHYPRTPAQLLAIDDRYGSLEAGKIADLVLYDGDPFEHSTHVTHTIMDGRVIYDRSEYLKMPFERRVLALIGGGEFGCCLGEW